MESEGESYTEYGNLCSTTKHCNIVQVIMTGVMILVMLDYNKQLADNKCLVLSSVSLLYILAKNCNIEQRDLFVGIAKMYMDSLSDNTREVSTV